MLVPFGLVLWFQLGLCGWSEIRILDLYPPISYGPISSVKQGDALYVATTASEYHGSGERTLKILLRTVGGREGFESEIRLREGEGNSYAQLVSDGQKLHLFWATGLVSREIPILTRLNWSQFVNGKWSMPRVILEEPRGINWDPNMSSDISVDTSGAIHMLIPLASSGLVYLHSNGDRWILIEPPVASASYVDLWVGNPDTIYAVLTGPSWEIEGNSSDDTHSVSVVKSYDRGTSWGKPITVSKSAHGPSSLPDLMLSDSGIFRLVWGKNRSGGPFPETIWFSSSEDRGETWTTPEEIDYGKGILRDVDLIDACGKPAIIFEVFQNSADFGVFYSFREESDWSQPEQITHGTGYSLTGIQGLDEALLIQTMRNEHEVFSAGLGQVVMPETVLRLFHFKGRVLD